MCNNQHVCAVYYIICVLIDLQCHTIVKHPSFMVQCSMLMHSSMHVMEVYAVEPLSRGHLGTSISINFVLDCPNREVS